MNQVILIDLKVLDLNASSNSFVVGLPPLTGVDGFVHNLERESGARIIGWSMGVSAFDLKDGYAKVVNYEISHKNKHAGTPYIRDRRTADLSGCLMLMIDPECPGREICEFLEDALWSYRFCGGTVQPGSGGVTLWNSIHDALAFVGNIHENTVFFLEDRSELIDQAPAGLSKVEWLMDLTARPFRNEQGQYVYAHGHEFLGHIVPVINGYQLLEAPQAREDLREDYAHAYAESTIGVARLRSLGSVLTHWNEATDSGVNIFWFGTFNPDQGTWRLLAFD